LAETLKRKFAAEPVNLSGEKAIQLTDISDLQD